MEAANWRPSSFCAGGECLEAGTCGHGVAVRAGRLGTSSPVLKFSGEAWAEFAARIRKGTAVGGGG